MDPNTARHVLRISPDARLTADLVERAHSSESWARHPSRYPDPEQRRQAEAWAATLDAARGVLLQGAPTPAPTFAAPAPVEAAPLTPAPLPTTAFAPAQPTEPPRRRTLRWPAIVGIVAGSLAVVAVITFAAIAGGRLLTTVATDAQQEFEDSMVDRYQSSETGYAFPAAIEYYGDGRYTDLCLETWTEGCWQAALFTEADCEHLQVLVAYSNDADAWSGDTEVTIEIEQVVAHEAAPVVFGNDAFAYGWVQQVTCLDEPTT